MSRGESDKNNLYRNHFPTGPMMRATDEEVLAQPCVVEALKKAYEDGANAAMYNGVPRDVRLQERLAERPDLAGMPVSNVRTIVFTGNYEDVAKQLALSLPVGDRMFAGGVSLHISDGGYTDVLWPTRSSRT